MTAPATGSGILVDAGRQCGVPDSIQFETTVKRACKALQVHSAFARTNPDFTK